MYGKSKTSTNNNIRLYVCYVIILEKKLFLPYFSVQIVERE